MRIKCGGCWALRPQRRFEAKKLPKRLILRGISAIQPRIPGASPAIRRDVEDGPERHQSGAPRGSCPGPAEAPFISLPQKCLIVPSRHCNAYAVIARSEATSDQFSVEPVDSFWELLRSCFSSG